MVMDLSQVEIHIFPFLGFYLPLFLSLLNVAISYTPDTDWNHAIGMITDFAHLNDLLSNSSEDGNRNTEFLPV